MIIKRLNIKMMYHNGLKHHDYVIVFVGIVNDQYYNKVIK